MHPPTPISLTADQFAEFARQGYNRIPLACEVLADLDTPLSAYLKLANDPYSFLFESVQGGETWGRYSILGLPAHIVLRVCGHVATVEHDGEVVETLNGSDPLTAIAQFSARFRAPDCPGLPRFYGGLVGYFGYETIGYIEPKLDRPALTDPLGVPDILLMLAEDLVIFDNLTQKLLLISHADPAEPNAYQAARERLDARAVRLRCGLPPRTPKAPRAVDEADFISGFTQAGFEDAVRRVKRYITDGDVMQVVLSQRLSVPLQAEPLDLYRALRCLNPSPYMFHINLKDFHLVGSSPEILVRLEDNDVTVRPIAGTRPRGRDRVEDLALEHELLADPKELAEHLMLIDLGRNDVGRVAATGSVRLTDKMVIERYSHVMHIVSNVTGRLQDGKTAFDVLRATFPAGTLSGAPKIRAMEIIQELEPVKRCVYGGAVGYIGWSGNMDTAIAIRTAVIKDGQLHIQAGAGIVYDSEPENEWRETMNKGRAMFRAVTLAEAGL